jgi:hypothetical protein
MFKLEALNLIKLKEQFDADNVIKYVVLDDFLSENKALSIADEHRNVPEEYWLDYSHKNQIKSGLTDKSLMGENTRFLLDELESPLFLKWLIELTGFKNLTSDPDLDRAGLHRIKKGGYLNVHIDEKSHTISPKFNRCVIFATDHQSYHGHPKPLKCPDNLARRSIALYYYQKVDKPLFITPTNYMSLPGDGLGKRFLIRFNVLLLYIFAVLKRYTGMTDKVLVKVTSFFR